MSLCGGVVVSSTFIDALVVLDDALVGYFSAIFMASGGFLPFTSGFVIFLINQAIFLFLRKRRSSHRLLKKPCVFFSSMFQRSLPFLFWLMIMIARPAGNCASHVPLTHTRLTWGPHTALPLPYPFANHASLLFFSDHLLCFLLLHPFPASFLPLITAHELTFSLLPCSCRCHRHPPFLASPPRASSPPLLLCSARGRYHQR